MLVLLIVVAAVVVLAVVLGLGTGFGGYGGPVVRRRIIYRRPPVRRVYTEEHIVDADAPIVDDGPAYRR